MTLFRRRFVRGDKPVAHTSWCSPQSKTGSTPFHQSQARRHANYLSPQQRNVPGPEPLLFSHRDYSTLWCSWTIRTGSSSAQSRWMHACEGRLADRGFDSWNRTEMYWGLINCLCRPTGPRCQQQWSGGHQKDVVQRQADQRGNERNDRRFEDLPALVCSCSDRKQSHWC